MPKLYSDIWIGQAQFKVSRPELIEQNPIEKEYENEICKYLKRREHIYKVQHTFMKKQMYLSWNMRSTLIDWLVTVSEEYKMSNRCIHLSVNYIDRFLSNISVVSCLNT